jgi:phosphotransferase system enzyme I (PtsI)
MIFRGKPVSEGVAIGKAWRFVPEELTVPAAHLEGADERQAALDSFLAARQTADAQLAALEESMAGADEAKIFAAHREILFDPGVEEEIRGGILDGGETAPMAVQRSCEQFAEILAGMDDPLFAGRAADLRDVEKRLLRILLGVAPRDRSHLPEDAVVLAEDLQPSDTAGMDRAHVAAIVTEKGGETSHSAIIARKFGIPALAGAAGLFKRVREGDDLIVDALEGRLYVGCSEEERREFEKKRADWKTKAGRTAEWRDAEPLLADGYRVKICVNIASADPDDLAPAAYTDGVGLLRSEFFYMNRRELPTEDEQFEAYRKVLEAYRGKEVILRTLDIGGDKKAECLDLPVEDNPFLGLRAVRLCFERGGVFKTQLRAALRAAKYGNLSLMLPMISSLTEIRKAKELLAAARDELAAEQTEYGDIRLGIMIEIPSIALQAEEVVKEVDFASIGTNDLTQYLLAVDRLNPEVADYYKKYHPAVFRLISYVAKRFREAGKPLSVCGELGGDALAAPVLVGMGIDKLSMNASSVARVKKTLGGLRREKCEALAAEVCKLGTAHEIEEYLCRELPG